MHLGELVGTLFLAYLVVLTALAGAGLSVAQWWDEALIFLAWALSDDGAFGRPFA